MIKSLTITNHLGNSITLELTRPDKSGFVVKGVEGLGPAKANINLTAFATSDGATYNSAFIDPRDITISLGYYQTSTETVEDLRHKAYKYFPTKKKIHLVIETDNRVVQTEGYVETHEPFIFSEDCGCTIQIRCPDPYLYSMDEVETVFYGIEPIFEFPFQNNSLSEPLLEMGTIINTNTALIFYEGDCEVGCTFVFDATGPVSDITIYKTGTDEYLAIDTGKLPSVLGSEIIGDDRIIVDTTVGNKSITLIRDGVRYNILNCLDKKSTWFTISKGDNIFSYTVGVGEEYLQFRISNKIVYYGV